VKTFLELVFELSQAHLFPPSSFAKDTQMLHSSSLFNDRDFLDQTLLDLELGKKLREQSGGPRVVAQLAGDDPVEMGRAGKLLIGLVDVVGELHYPSSSSSIDPNLS